MHQNSRNDLLFELKTICDPNVRGLHKIYGKQEGAHLPQKASRWITKSAQVMYRAETSSNLLRKTLQLILRSRGGIKKEEQCSNLLQRALKVITRSAQCI